MKKCLLLLSVLLLIIGLSFFRKPDHPAEIIRSRVVDRAMDAGLPYIGISVDTGEALCIYWRSEESLPDRISPGDLVEVRYETIPFPQGIRHFAISITELDLSAG